MRMPPHALFEASTGFGRPAEHRRTVSPHRPAQASGADGAFVVVPADVRLDTLRRALAGGATRLALAGCRTGADVQRLAALLCVAEAEEGLAEDSTLILAMTDGILPAPVSPQGFAGKSRRLAALVWDRIGLERSLGASCARTEGGQWRNAFCAARAAVLLSAAAAGVPAYDTATALSGDAFAADCRQSRGDGFFGRVATDAAQLSVIEAVYG